MNKNVYSVTQINTYIERMFQDDFMLSNISVTGEVSNCKYNHTGHIYFSLKDEKAHISCVMFSSKRMKGLSFPMKDGDKVVVKGYVSVYTAAGTYQLYASSVELAGRGDLYQQFEALKAELEESGMFSDIYKKPLPSYATKIGVVTAPTGAAVHDIIRVSKSKNPYVKIVLYPAQVQGQAAAGSIVEGIKALDEMGLDLIIVGRGGGSIEDLWAFNEEVVARAIFNATTPIISAVGHETDFTIADFVADKRAATPTHAAELANFSYEEFLSTLERFNDRMQMALDFKLNNYSDRLLFYKRQLVSLSPESKLKAQEDMLKTFKLRINHAMENTLVRDSNRLSLISSRLEGLSPAKKIANGFGFVTKDGARVESVKALKKDDYITTRMSDGTITSRVCDIAEI